MKSRSAAFDYVWADPTRTRVWKVELYRRYNNGAAFVLEASPITLYKHEIVDISAITRRMDDRGGLRISNVTLKLPNHDQEWLEENTINGRLAPDATATLGYDLRGAEVYIYAGFKLDDGTEEYLTMFSGRIEEEPTYDTVGGVITIPVMAIIEAKLKHGVAQSVCVTSTDQPTDPTQGDGSNLIFGTGKKSAFSVYNVREAGTPRVLGDEEDYTVDDLNDAEVAASLRFNVGREPANLAAILFDVKQWWRDISPATAVKKLLEAAGLTSSDWIVEEPVFPAVDQSVVFETQADWLAGSLTNADGVSLENFLRRRWWLYDDGSSTTGWTSGATPITSSGGKLIFGGNSTNGMVAYKSHNRQSGTFQMKLTRITAGPYFMMVFPFGRDSGMEYGFYVDRAAAGSGIGLVASDRSAIGSGTSALVEGSEHTIRMTWTVDASNPSTINIVLYLDGSQISTASVSGYTVNRFSVWNSNPGSLTGDCIKLDDMYFSNATLAPADAVETADTRWVSAEQDLLAAPTAWLPLNVVAQLQGGTITLKTDVASASGGPYDGEVAVDGSNTPQSNLKRYAKLIVETTIGAFAEAPEIERLDLRWRGDQLFIKSLDLTGYDNCLAAIAEIAAFCGMDWGSTEHAMFYFRNRVTAGAPDLVLDQKNGLIDVVGLTKGWREVKNFVAVRYGKSGDRGYYSLDYDKTDAGDTFPTSEDRFGVCRHEIVLDRFLFSNNANVAEAVASKAYADRKNPKRKAKSNCRFIPHLEMRDRTQQSFHRSPLIADQVFGDPLQVNPAIGGASNTLLRDVSTVVRGKSDRIIQGQTDFDWEEILS